MSEKNQIQAAAQGAVTSFQGAKMGSIQATFAQYRETIAQVMPKKAIEADRIITIASQMVASNPMIAKCDVKSIIGAVIQCAITGLNPTPQYGEVYFVPYGSSLQMQMGYKGWAKLAHKSGIITSIDSYAVYEGDAFSFGLGLKPFIDHVPGENYGDASKLTHAYAVIHLKGGAVKFEVLNKRQIERLRGKSPMQKNGINGAWASDYDQMAKAKAVKQALKLVPMEDEWREVFFQDEAIAPSVDDFKRDGSGRSTVDFSYPNEVVDVAAEVVDGNA
jgi:recombination protein RecT